LELSVEDNRWLHSLTHQRKQLLLVEQPGHHHSEGLASVPCSNGANKSLELVLLLAQMSEPVLATLVWLVPPLGRVLATLV